MRGLRCAGVIGTLRSTQFTMTLPRQLSRRHALGALVVAGLGAPFLRSTRAQATGATIHFYSPETNINNFGTLKSEFDGFFKEAGGHKFQPYGDRATFEKAMEGNPGGLFLLSSWHYPQLAKKAAWQPTLIGQLREKTTQRHVLCAKQAIANFAALKGAKVASAGNKAFTLNLLAGLLGAEHRALVTEQNILAVPKDIDALMAPVNGVAQAAVATEGSLARLARTNAKQHDALNQLAKGPERLLPIVVAPAVPDAASQALLKVLASMGADAEGQQRLRLLGLDGLVPIADAQRTELRK
jgi:ABC transporter, phosphonate, periplasmic substrate-binding protein